MKLIVLSGKGGTGKTTVAVNLAKTLDWAYADLDVEEPNGHIYLQPTNLGRRSVSVPVPQVDRDACMGCGICSDACQFNALYVLGDQVYVHEQLCHSCGRCRLVCPAGAMQDTIREIGHMEAGTAGLSPFYTGRLNPTEPMAGPIVESILEQIETDGISRILLDGPPGASCNTADALRGAERALVVLEPTRLSLHDGLKVMELLERQELAYGVVFNKTEGNSTPFDPILQERGIDILGYIPFSKSAAHQSAEGQLLIQDGFYARAFLGLAARIQSWGGLS